MNLKKTCETCEFNFSGKCANEGEIGPYGTEITDLVTERECWSIGLNYYSDLLDMLPEREHQIAVHSGWNEDRIVATLIELKAKAH